MFSYGSEPLVVFPFLFVYFQYVHSQAVEHYIVTVQKVSGEAAEESSYVLKAQTVTLFLCYSAYKLAIAAFNEAGTSPAAHVVIDAMEDQSGRSSQTFLMRTMGKEYVRIHVICSTGYGSFTYFILDVFRRCSLCTQTS